MDHQRIPLPVCESGGADDVSDRPLPPPDPPGPPQGAAAARCLRCLLPGRTGNGHTGRCPEGPIYGSGQVCALSWLMGESGFFPLSRVVCTCFRSTTTTPAAGPACCSCPSSNLWPSAGFMVQRPPYLLLQASSRVNRQMSKQIQTLAPRN